MAFSSTTDSMGGESNASWIIATLYQTSETASLGMVAESSFVMERIISTQRISGRMKASLRCYISLA